MAIVNLKELPRMTNHSSPRTRPLVDAYLELGKNPNKENRDLFQNVVRDCLNASDTAALRDLIQQADNPVVHSHVTWTMDDAAITQKTIKMVDGRSVIFDQVLVLMPVITLGGQKIPDLSDEQMQKIESLGHEKGYLPVDSSLTLCKELISGDTLSSLDLVNIHQVLHDLADVAHGGTDSETQLEELIQNRALPGTLSSEDEPHPVMLSYAIGILTGPENSLGRRFRPDGQPAAVDPHLLLRREDTLSWCIEAMRLLDETHGVRGGQVQVLGLYRFIDGLQLGITQLNQARIRILAASQRSFLGKCSDLCIQLQVPSDRASARVAFKTLAGNELLGYDISIQQPRKKFLNIADEGLRQLCDYSGYTYLGHVATGTAAAPDLPSH